MKRTRMSLATIKEKLSRAEMKKILAGSGSQCVNLETWCRVGDECTFSNGGTGKCSSNSAQTMCYCAGAS